MKKLKRRCETEERLLKGFQEEEEKEQRIFRKDKINPIDEKGMYLKELELFEKGKIILN